MLTSMNTIGRVVFVDAEDMSREPASEMHGQSV